MKLALDIGLHCGWALFDASANYLIGYGTMPLGCSAQSCTLCRPRRGGGPLPQRERAGAGETWQTFLASMMFRVTQVAYEKVPAKVQRSEEAVYLYGGFQLLLQMACHRYGRPLADVNVSSWKATINQWPAARAKKPKRSERVVMPLLGPEPPAHGWGVGRPSTHLYVHHVNALTGLSLREDEHDAAAAIGVGLHEFCRAGMTGYKFKRVSRLAVNDPNLVVEDTDRHVEAHR